LAAKSLIREEGKEYSSTLKNVTREKRTGEKKMSRDFKNYLMGNATRRFLAAASKRGRE